MSSTMRRLVQSKCPHCEKDIVVVVIFGMADVSADVLTPELGEMKDIPAKADRFTAREEEILKSATLSGVFPAFKSAVERVQEGQRPKHVERFFLNFLRTATRKIVPHDALEVLLREFGRQSLEVWGNSSLLAIVSGGVIKAFVPYTVVKPAPLTFHEGGRFRADTEENGAMREWTKTRWGYVVGRGEFYDVLRKRSIGEFARPSL